MVIIGITGTLGAGKGTIVEHLKNRYGFRHYSARDFIVLEAKRRGLDLNRDNITRVADDLRKSNHPGFIIEELYNEAVKNGENAVIESVRAIGELKMMRKRAGDSFYLFAVNADIRKRFDRISSRKSITDNVSFEKFVSDENKEMGSGDPARGDIAGCIKLADFRFINNGTIKDLENQVDKAMEKIINGKD